MNGGGGGKEYLRGKERVEVGWERLCVCVCVCSVYICVSMIYGPGLAARPYLFGGGRKLGTGIKAFFLLRS